MLHIPTGTKKAAIVVRCNPRLFELRCAGSDTTTTGVQQKDPVQPSDNSTTATAPRWVAAPIQAARKGPLLGHICNGGQGHGVGMVRQRDLSNLQYRIVFAVVTLDSVFVYDTQSWHPFLALHHMHYSQLTDACWSADGSVLFISSNDGYCSIVEFQ